MQVEGQHCGRLRPLVATGARVSNAYPTCRLVRHSPLKGGLIPDVVAGGHPPAIKDSIGTPMGMRTIR